MIDEKLARQAYLRRKINSYRDGIWIMTKKFRKAALIATGIGGVQALEGSLNFRILRNNEWYDFGCVGHKVITTAFAEFVVDQLISESSAFGDFKWHQLGTGSTAENASDVALVTPVETVTAGTQVEDSSKVYKSVASISITDTRVLREHGIFNNKVPASGTLLDRTLFDAVTLGSGDVFEATYKLTVSDNT